MKIKKRGNKILKRIGSGRAMTFASNSDRVELPAGATLKGLGNATAECWFKPTSNPSNNAPIYYESTVTGGGFTRFGIYQTSAGEILAVVRDSDSGTAFTITYSGVKNNTWYHLAITYDSSTDIFALYVNGVLIGSNSAAKGTFSNTVPVAISIGHAPNISTSIRGVIDEMRIWTTTRTQDQIKSNMFKEVSPQAGLLFYSPIRNSSGNLLDESGNSLNGSVTGTTRNISDSPVNVKLIKAA